MAIDLSLTPDEVLVRHINKIYQRNFSLDNVYFDRRTLTEINQHGCDTMVIMRSKVGSGRSGALRIFYNRINLTSFLQGQTVLVGEKIQLTGQARPAVLNEVGIRLGRIDVISDVIYPDTVDDLLRISGRSLIYAGSINLKYSQSLKDRLANTLLNGFYAPDSEE